MLAYEEVRREPTRELALGHFLQGSEWLCVDPSLSSEEFKDEAKSYLGDG